jgi:hypothetical protein
MITAAGELTADFLENDFHVCFRSLRYFHGDRLFSLLRTALSALEIGTP